MSTKQQSLPAFGEPLTQMTKTTHIDRDN